MSVRKCFQLLPIHCAGFGELFALPLLQPVIQQLTC